MKRKQKLDDRVGRTNLLGVGLQLGKRPPADQNSGVRLESLDCETNIRPVLQDFGKTSRTLELFEQQYQHQVDGSRTSVQPPGCER